MLRIAVLGRLALERHERPLSLPVGRPARLLLGWLALHPGAHSRAAVAAELWPDVLDESARGSLRVALVEIRRGFDQPDAACEDPQYRRVGSAEDAGRTRHPHRR